LFTFSFYKIDSFLFCCCRPEAVAQCVLDLIRDESDVGQVVKVTYEDGVEFLNYNDVSRRVGESDLT